MVSRVWAVWGKVVRGRQNRPMPAVWAFCHQQGRPADSRALEAKAETVSTSTWIMYVLIVFYFAIMLFSAYEANWWRALYYLAAILISVAVLGMTWQNGIAR